MYLPIQDHGIIGDLQTVALVGIDGTIDWCCLPSFDSPSVFASLLDDEIGGWFRLSVQGSVRQKQQYLPDSAILVTRTFAENGLGQIEDFMPIAEDEKRFHRIIRRVSCVRGEIHYKLDCRPATDFARKPHKVVIKPRGALFEATDDHLYGLLSPVPLNDESPSVTAELVLKQGDSMSFIFFCTEKQDGDFLDRMSDGVVEFHETRDFWTRWTTRCTYKGRWSEMVYRSAVTLKLLTYNPTGAIVASPTTSLPESIGGNRNWDYRYTWLRDSSFTLHSFMSIGYAEEAGQFMNWVQNLSWDDHHSETPLHVMYGIRGNTDLAEYSLDHLKGYRHTRPVRVGNAAHDQLQLDIYGEFMDTVYLYNKHVTRVPFRLWEDCRQLLDWVCTNWDKRDAGIWESRGPRRYFVYSQMMCWVALDRAIRMSIGYGLPGEATKWVAERDKIYDRIMRKGWNEQGKFFRQDFDLDNLDASALLMPMMQFIAPTDPRMTSTIDAIIQNLSMDSLVYRYHPERPIDDLSGEEGTFCMCTFWLVECLARAGRTAEARMIFERMLGYANHLGLYAEEVGLHGEALGNFPQAFTHLGLISAAYSLNLTLNQEETKHAGRAI